jgi:hypothetical protein
MSFGRDARNARGLKPGILLALYGLTKVRPYYKSYF